MQFLGASETLDGGNFRTLMHDGERQARKHAAAVDVDGAGAALPVIAALFGAGKLQVFAKRVEQCHARLETNPVFATIDVQDYIHQWFGHRYCGQGLSTHICTIHDRWDLTEEGTRNPRVRRITSRSPEAYLT